jgi:hypothetical protein
MDLLRQNPNVLVVVGVGCCMEILGWGDGNSFVVVESSLIMFVFSFSGTLVDHVLLLGWARVVVAFFLSIGIGFNV